MLAVSTVAALVARAMVLARVRTLAWGTLDGERVGALSGDDLVPDAAVVATRAVTIDAPPQEVWRWIVQLGQGRGGFYSYDRLENLLGLDIHSADSIQERWQKVVVGDEIRLAEEVALRVALVRPPEHLVLLGAPEPGESDAMPMRMSWAFVVRGASPREGAAAATTRLIVRERYQPLSVAGRAMVEAVQPVSFLMSQKMLRGIRDRAERAQP
ncbi:MAG TPA: hypothetical protein DHV14_00580 [Micrococcales bacterium]|nr:hypothetical protein [Micrococcales bacterium]